MTTFKQLDLPTLSSSDRTRYKRFTSPKFRCILEGKNPDSISFSKQIAITSETNALCLASFYDGLAYADIHSLYVDPSVRNQKIGSQLLKEMEKTLVKMGSESIIMHYQDDDPTTPFLENIFKKESWSVKKQVMEQYFFDCKTFNPYWYKHPPKLPHKIVEFPWDTLKATEREQIEKDYKQGHFDSGVHPFLEEETIEPINSIGLRYKNRVIGWMICHRVAPDTIRYTAFYVKPEFCFRGYSIRLLVDAIQLQQQSTIKWSLFDLNLDQTPKSWIKFCRRRLAPYALKVVRIYQTWKMFKST